MKKLLTASIITAAFFAVVLSDPSVVSAQEAQPATQFKMSEMVSTVDGIQIPHAVLDYVQLTYDGHAVTEAERTVMNGREAYRLRVDRDDLANDYASFTLLFDAKWQLFGKEELTPPPKPQPKPVQQKEKEKEKPKPETRGSDDKEERESDGSGGDAADDEQPAIKPDEEDDSLGDQETDVETSE